MKYLVCLCLFLLSCAPAKQSDLVVRLEATNFSVGAVPLVLQLEFQNKPLTEAVVTIRGDMTHAGMSPVQAKARELGAGRYAVSNFAFSMAGDWVLSVSAIKGDQTLLGEVKLGINP
jgi:uncharacterized protein (DUF2141 family)